MCRKLTSTIRSGETCDDVQAIAKCVGIDKADTCSAQSICIGRVYVSGQNDPSIELKLLPEVQRSQALPSPSVTCVVTKHNQGWWLVCGKVWQYPL